MMNKPYVRRHPEPVSETALEKLLKRVGDTRDGVLMSISAIYVLGYIVWSYYAWQHGLGLRPAVDVQYFVAGFVPALLLYSVIIGIRWDQRLSLRLNAYLIPRSTVRPRLEPKRTWTIRRVLFFVWAAACCRLITIYFMHSTVGPWWLNVPLSLVSFYAALIGTPIVVQWFVPAAREERSPADLWLASFYSLFFGFLMLTLYIQVFYPIIPPAWGGVRPQAATLDIIKTQVSDETLAALLPLGRHQSAKTVVRTVPVDIMFQGSSTILVRPRSPGLPSGLYELKSGSVQGILWAAKQ